MPNEKTAPFDAQAFLRKADKGHTVSKYQKDSIVFSQDDPADDVFYIQEGKVKMTVVSRRGKEAVVGIFTASQFFGEGALSGQTVRISTATTMEECDIARLSKTVMMNIIHAEPEFAQFFIAYLLARNLRVEEDLVDQLFNSSEKRLARILLLLANFGKEGEPETVIPNITQEVLAEMVGTTRSRVSFFMNKFRKLGFIEYNGKLTIHSSLLNVVLHD